MTTNGIFQTGIESSLVNHRMNELNQQAQAKQDKGKNGPITETDIVKIAVNASERPGIEFEALNEDEANILAQLVANTLSRQPFGIAAPAGVDVLRTFV